MSNSLPPFWPNTLRRFGNIFFGTLSVAISLTAISVGFSVIAGILTIATGGAKVDNYQFVSGKRSSENRLLKIAIRGPILGSPIDDSSSLSLGGLGGLTYGYQVQTLLDKAAQDSQSKVSFCKCPLQGGQFLAPRPFLMASRRTRK